MEVPKLFNFHDPFMAESSFPPDSCFFLNFLGDFHTYFVSHRIHGTGILTRWWFQMFLIFILYLGKIPILTNISSDGLGTQPPTSLHSGDFFVGLLC